MAIPVDQVLQVKHSRCLACMNCIEACPTKTVRPISWGPPGWLGHAWPQKIVIAVLFVCSVSALAAAYFAPVPSFVKTRGTAPEQVATVELKIRELTCRGRANLLVGFLDRDDIYQIPGAEPDTPGYYKLEAWPDPSAAIVRISYDPTRAHKDAIRRAVTEPYFDVAENRWWVSPFIIEGYDPLGLDNGAAEQR